MNRYLISRSINRKIKLWEINLSASPYQCRYGNIGDTLQIIFLNETKDQLESRIRKKLKRGYIEITEEQYRTGNFDKLLPETNTDLDGNLKPMKAQKFALNKFEYPAIAQPKINGLRAFIIWGTVIEEEGMFANSKEQAIILSSDGNRYVLPHIEKQFTKDLFEKVDAYDGELYVPGLSLNQIRASVPTVNMYGTVSKVSGKPENVQLWMCDVADADLSQVERLSFMSDIGIRITDLKNHYDYHIIKSKQVIINVGSITVYSDDNVIQFTDECIRNGFEGSIIRDVSAPYCFGQRPKTMMKAKRFQDAEFVIEDIYLKSGASRDTVLFTLRNDINSETFDAVPMGTINERMDYYNNRETIIGKKATVKFYERSGVKKVPFHGNVVTIRDYE